MPSRILKRVYKHIAITCSSFSGGYTLREPRISVVIPAYNAAQFIPEAVQSVIGQTLSACEIIVVNDGSPDTPVLEAALMPFRERIVYLQQPNGGPSAARNTGIRRAEGEFIAFIDSDDTWHPDYLAEQMRVFEQHPAADAVGADMSTYGDAEVHPATLTTAAGPAQQSISLVDLLLLNFVLLPSSTVVRRSTLLSVGLFDESIVRGEDWDLWMRIAHQGGRIVAQRKTLGRRRIHSGGLTRGAWESLKDEARILIKWQDMAGLSPEIRQLLNEKLAQVKAYIDLEEGKRLLKSGDSAEAQLAFGRAYRFFSRPNLQERAMSTGPIEHGRVHDFLRRNKLRLLLGALRYCPRLTTLSVKARASDRR